jgi:Cu/Ag efflux pump CusA
VITNRLRPLELGSGLASQYAELGIQFDVRYVHYRFPQNGAGRPMTSILTMTRLKCDAVAWLSRSRVQVMQASLPTDVSYDWTGAAYQEKRAGSSSGFAFGAALVMVFLILAAQYESWSLPGAVLHAVPFALFGALLTVWLRGLNNDIYFQIGLVTLMGSHAAAAAGRAVKPGLRRGYSA